MSSGLTCNANKPKVLADIVGSKRQSILCAKESTVLIEIEYALFGNKRNGILRVKLHVLH